LELTHEWETTFTLLDREPTKLDIADEPFSYAPLGLGNVLNLRLGKGFASRIKLAEEPDLRQKGDFAAIINVEGQLLHVYAKHQMARFPLFAL
jgi:hypothetical protein